MPTPSWPLYFGVIIPSGSVPLILPFIFLFVGMICSEAIYKLISSLLSARISTRLKLNLDSAIYARIMFLEPSYFKTTLWAHPSTILDASWYSAAPRGPAGLGDS